MKLLKLGLRFWIMLSSVFTFLAGWAMLAHAPKPTSSSPAQTPSASVAPLPTLVPLQPLNFSANGSTVQTKQFSAVQPAAPSFFSPAPVFNTGGS